MAAKVWIGLRSSAEYLRRLSVVFAVELRLRIVTELYMREMSPKEFYEEFGGGSISRVTQNFEKLAEHSWLRYIRSEGPGGRRHGAKEHFFRATELAIFDYETWALLPYSLRAAFSWTAIEQFAERWLEAMEAGTFDARPERHRSCRTLRLDRQGWDRAIAAIDRLFVSLFEEQGDARIRAFHSGEKLMRATIALAAFESPGKNSEGVGPVLAESRGDASRFPVRVAKLLGDEDCMQILTAANLRRVSAPQFHAEFGGDRDAIRRRFKKLEEFCWLTMVGEKTGGARRGGAEKFYRATGPALRNSRALEAPDSITEQSSWKAFEEIAELAKEAMRAGTFDARADRYCTWSLLALDEEGWKKVTAAIEALLTLLHEEQENAIARLKMSGEEPILMTVALAAFESPAQACKEP
jgi:hypothetical protein